MLARAPVASRSSAVSFWTRRRQLQDLVSEARLSEVHDSQTDHDRQLRAQPRTRRLLEGVEVRGDRHVGGAMDEIPKPVIVALLPARRSRHGHDHRPFPQAVQLLEDDGGASAGVTTTRSRGQVQNVRDQPGRRTEMLTRYEMHYLHQRFDAPDLAGSVGLPSLGAAGQQRGASATDAPATKNKATKTWTVPRTPVGRAGSSRPLAQY